SSMQAPDRAAGRRTSCPKCGQLLRVPGAAFPPPGTADAAGDAQQPPPLPAAATEPEPAVAPPRQEPGRSKKPKSRLTANLVMLGCGLMIGGTAGYMFGHWQAKHAMMRALQSRLQTGADALMEQPSSADELYERAARLMSTQQPKDAEKALAGPIREYLDRYG